MLVWYGRLVFLWHVEIRLDVNELKVSPERRGQSMRTERTVHRAAWSQIKRQLILSQVQSSRWNRSITIFEVKLTFEKFTVHGQQHSFSTHGWVFLWKCQSFWDRKCLDLRTTRTPSLRIHAECSNYLSYQGQTFFCPMFLNTGSGGIDIFVK